MLRRWVVLALAKLWENHREGKRIAIKENAHEKLCGLLTDPVPEVRLLPYMLWELLSGDQVRPGEGQRGRRVLSTHL